MGLIDEANSKAISKWANVPTLYFPDLDIIPIALVFLIHFVRTF